MRTSPAADGRFVDGNIAQGTPGTVVSAAWLNMMQDEIISVLSAAGIAVDGSKSDQLASAIQTLLRGKATINVAGGVSVILTAAQYGMPILILTGALTANINVIFPASSGAWIVRNQTTGNFTVTCKTQAGAGTVVSQGCSNALYCDGVNIAAEQTDWAGILSQVATAFTTSGAAPNFVLTPTPAMTEYAPNQRLRIKFHVAGTWANTLNVSALGAKNIRQYDATGAKVAAKLAAGQLADVEYDGTDFVVLDPLPAALPAPACIQGASKNLCVSTTGVSAIVTVSADELALESASSGYVIVRSVNLTINCAAAGAGGLDTGTLLAAGWYSVWVIWSGNTVSGLLSASGIGPTLPAGYTHCARVGWVRTDGTANKYPYPFVQYGRTAEYVPTAGSNLTSYFVVQSGTSSGTVSLAAYTPPTASAALIAVKTSPTTDSFIAAGKTSGDVSSNRVGQISATSATAMYEGNTVGRISYAVASQIYVISTGAANSTRVLGWEDNL